MHEVIRLNFNPNINHYGIMVLYVRFCISCTKSNFSRVFVVSPFLHFDAVKEV